MLQAKQSCVLDELCSRRVILFDERKYIFLPTDHWTYSLIPTWVVSIKDSPMVIEIRIVVKNHWKELTSQRKLCIMVSTHTTTSNRLSIWFGYLGWISVSFWFNNITLKSWSRLLVNIILDGLITGSSEIHVNYWWNNLCSLVFWESISNFPLLSFFVSTYQVICLESCK